MVEEFRRVEAVLLISVSCRKICHVLLSLVVVIVPVFFMTQFLPLFFGPLFDFFFFLVILLFFLSILSFILV